MCTGAANKKSLWRACVFLHKHTGGILLACVARAVSRGDIPIKANWRQPAIDDLSTGASGRRTITNSDVYDSLGQPDHRDGWSEYRLAPGRGAREDTLCGGPAGVDVMLENRM